MSKTKLQSAGVVYDATIVSSILGLQSECSSPAPQARAGEIIVYYGGWDVRTLWYSHMKQKPKEQWFPDRYNTKSLKAKRGYYRVLLPVPDSNDKGWEEQISHLRIIGPRWKPSPIAVAATALVVHQEASGEDMWYGECRCRERLPDGSHLMLTEPDDPDEYEDDLGNVRFDIWEYPDHVRCGFVYLSAAQLVSGRKS